MLARLAVIVGVSLLVAAHPSMAEERVTIFAAASLRNAIDDINATFMKQTGFKVVASYAASSALIKQVKQGAPADVYASADIDWMDYASQYRLIKDGTRIDLLGNRLVLITSKDSKISDVDLKPGFGLVQLAGGGRIAVADTRAVPAGKYAKAALENLGEWTAAVPNLAMTENVRVTLALVARGEAALGIVYETDAKIEPGVKIIGTFPDNSHPAIIYPMALTISAKPEAERYLAFLRSRTAKSIFEAYGFRFLIRPTS